MDTTLIKMKSMRNVFILIFVLLVPFLSFSNCLEEQLLKVSQSIKYPTIFWENDIEDAVTIYITKDNIRLIERKFSASKQELLDKSIIEMLSECTLEKYSSKFLFQFKLGKIDTVYIDDNNLIFQKKAVKYFAVPASTSCNIYANSKMVIEKNKEKHRSRAMIKTGKKLVFQYHYEGETNPYDYYNDDEKISIITFQINNEFDDFEYHDDNLKKIKLHSKKLVTLPP